MRRLRPWREGQGEPPAESLENDVSITVVNWNINKKDDAWRQLVQMDADLALLQETTGRTPSATTNNISLVL